MINCTFMLYRYITNSCSGATIPARSEKMVWWFISADSSPVNFYQTGQALDLCSHYVMGLCFMCWTFPLAIGSCPRSHGILYAFIAPSVRFHHVLRVCTTLLLCPQYVKVICTEFLPHYPHVLHSKTINISAKREVCRPKCLYLPFFFFAK